MGDPGDSVVGDSGASHSGAGDLVPVFETADPSLLPVAQSLLGGAEIAFWVEGDEAMSLLPVGDLLGPFTRRGLAARILVRPEDAEFARGLLQDLESHPPVSDEEE
jgi:hypothetical protein